MCWDVTRRCEAGSRGILPAGNASAGLPQATLDRDTIGPVRRLLLWIVVTLGIAALVRRLRRHDTADVGADSPAEAAPPPEAGADDPADELRRRLAESRDEPAVSETVESRRADVHDEGRAALDEMQKTTED